MKPLKYAVILIFFVFAIGCRVKESVKWTGYTSEAMQAAKASGKPIIVDFYAAWCGPCMDMKEHTFTDERVIAALAGFERLKADMSFQESRKVQEIADQYEIEGLPTMILFSPGGLSEVRLRGYYSPGELLSALSRFKEKFNLSDAPVQAPSGAAS